MKIKEVIELSLTYVARVDAEQNLLHWQIRLVQRAEQRRPRRLMQTVCRLRIVRRAQMPPIPPKSGQTKRNSSYISSMCAGNESRWQLPIFRELLSNRRVLIPCGWILWSISNNEEWLIAGSRLSPHRLPRRRIRRTAKGFRLEVDHVYTHTCATGVVYKTTHKARRKLIIATILPQLIWDTKRLSRILMYRVLRPV